MVVMKNLKGKKERFFFCYLYSVSWNHPRLPFELSEGVCLYNKLISIDPCDDQGPRCHRPHQPQVPFGSVGLGGQGCKS